MRNLYTQQACLHIVLNVAGNHANTSHELLHSASKLLDASIMKCKHYSSILSITIRWTTLTCDNGLPKSLMSQTEPYGARLLPSRQEAAETSNETRQEDTCLIIYKESPHWDQHWRFSSCWHSLSTLQVSTVVISVNKTLKHLLLTLCPHLGHMQPSALDSMLVWTPVCMPCDDNAALLESYTPVSRPLSEHTKRDHGPTPVVLGCLFIR